MLCSIKQTSAERLSGAPNLSYAEAPEADFSYPTLNAAILDHAVLEGTNLKGAILVGAKMREIRLSDTTNLVDADVTEVVLDEESMTKAKKLFPYLQAKLLL